MISSSLKVSNEVFAHPIVWIPDNPQWRNYLKIFEVLPFAKFAWNTVIVTGLAVLGTVASSLTVGYAFARLRFGGRSLLLKAMLLFQMFPAVLALVAYFALFSRISNYFPPLGLNTHPGLIFAYLGGIALAVRHLDGKGLVDMAEAFGFNRTGALGNTIFVEFKFSNKGANLIEDTYVAVFYDPDLGQSNDDAGGTDPDLGIVYVHNGDNYPQ